MYFIIVQLIAAIVLLLWAVEGLKYREIADVLDIPLGTIMSRLHRARAILMERLADMAREAGIGRVGEPTPATVAHGAGDDKS